MVTIPYKSIFLVDGANNPVGVVLDGSVYRLQVETKVVALPLWKPTQVVVGVTATQLAAVPLSDRRSISLKAPPGPEIIYIGTSDAVTGGTGYPLRGGDAIDLDLGPSALVWAIASAANQLLYVVEIGG